MIRTVALTVAAILFSSHVMADCDDTIERVGVYDTGAGNGPAVNYKNVRDYASVAYHTNKYHTGDIKKAFTDAGCKKLSGTKHWPLPSVVGAECAKTRIDGCSIPKDVRKLFSERDLKLMTGACNAHDLCYSTAGTFKVQCDFELQDNLQAIKKEFSGSFIIKAITNPVMAFGDHHAGQQWGQKHCKAEALYADPGAHIPLRSARYSSSCLDFVEGKHHTAELWECNQTAYQSWSFHHYSTWTNYGDKRWNKYHNDPAYNTYYQIQSDKNGYCLNSDHKTGGGRTGYINLSECSAGLDAQMFEILSNGRLKNKRTEQCLKSEQKKSGSKTFIYSADCDGSASEAWLVFPRSKT
ncbi:MAG: ricin-type beta-trefoil lectin domain protein [Halocynthiibacter sp.]